MDKLTAIKIKYDDGTYSDEIPVSVLAENVEWDSTHTLVDVLGSIDVDITGTIQDQISQLFNEKVNYTYLNNYVASELNADVSSWLNENVNPVGSAVIVDKSLSIENAAADAKITGEIKKNIYSLHEKTKNLWNEGDLTFTGWIQQSLSYPLQAGTYIFSTYVENMNDLSLTAKVNFRLWSDATPLHGTEYFSKNMDIPAGGGWCQYYFTIPGPARSFRLTNATTVAASQTVTLSYTKIQIEKIEENNDRSYRTSYIQPYSGKDQIFRQMYQSNLDLILENTNNIWELPTTISIIETAKLQNKWVLEPGSLEKGFTTIILNTPLEPGDYTLSFKINGTEGTTPKISFYDMQSLSLPGTNKIIDISAKPVPYPSRIIRHFSLNTICYSIRLWSGSTLSASINKNAIFSEIQLEKGSSETPFIENKTAIDYIARQTYSTYPEVEDRVFSISEQTRNLFNQDLFFEKKEGVTKIQNEFVATNIIFTNNNTETATIMTVPIGKVYTISMTARAQIIDSANPHSGNGLCIFEDSSHRINWYYSTFNDIRQSLTIDNRNGTEEKRFYFYASSGLSENYLWYIKDIQVEQGDIPTAFVGKYTSVDYVARAASGKLLSTNDSTDRTVEIQNLLDNTNYCELGPGDFYISEIVMPQYSSLIGCGGKTRLFFTQSTGTAITMGTHCLIKNLDLYGDISDIELSSTISEKYGIGWTTPDTIQYGIISKCRITRFSGAAILLQNTGAPVDHNCVISDCFIYNNNVGIYIKKDSEFHKICNNTITRNYYGILNRGGNNNIDNCGIDANIIGIQIDADEGKNNGHGAVSNCSINHSDSNTGYGIIVKGTGRELFTNCNIYYSKIKLENTNGNIISNCGFGSTVGLEIINGGCNLICNCLMRSSEDFPIIITNNTQSKIINCYTRDGLEINFPT